MAGLLDFYSSPEQQQMLGLVSGLLSAGGRSPTPVSIGQGLGQGLLTGSRLANAARQGQLQGLQGEAMKHSLEATKRTQAAIDALAQQLPEAERGRFLADPAGYLKAQNEGFTLKPGDTRYRGNQPIASSAPNLHFQDTGAGVVGLNPQTGAQGSPLIPKSVDPNTQARLDWDRYQFGNLSNYQGRTLGNESARIGLDRERVGMDRQRLGLEGLNTFYNTGMGLPGMGLPGPVGPQTPPFAGAPSAPMVAPGAAPGASGAGLPPKLKNELALAGLKAGAEVTGKAQAQSALDLPQAAATAETAVNLIDQMVGTRGKQLKAGEKEVPPHPGFADVIGATWKPGARFVHGTSAAGFDALLEQVKGGAFLQAFETLKGGGQITEVEGKKATAAITRMDRAQDEAEFVKAAREYQDVIRAGVARAKQKAGAPAGNGWSIRPAGG